MKSLTYLAQLPSTTAVQLLLRLEPGTCSVQLSYAEVFLTIMSSLIKQLTDRNRLLCIVFERAYVLYYIN